MDANDYVYYFYSFSVGKYYDNFYHNFIEVTNEALTSRTFQFTLPAASKAFVGIEFYNPRMYPLTCRDSVGCYQAYGYMTLKSSAGTQLYGGWAQDWLGFSHYEGDLAAGTYTLTINNFKWCTYDVKDYTFKVYTS